MANAPQPPARKSSKPSLFNNEYSRGPLYQYWRERHREGLGTRERRILDAKERAKGKQPVSPEAGPSSNSEYQRRLARGLVAQPTPAYEVSEVSGGTGTGQELPSYVEVSAQLAEEKTFGGSRKGGDGSVSEKKERLQRQHAEQEFGGDVMQWSASEAVPEAESCN